MRAFVLALCATVLAGCAHQPTRLQHVHEDAILVVVDDPRPERLRNFAYGSRYASPIAYDQDPILKRYANKIAGDHGQDVLLQWPLRSLTVHCFVIDRPSEEVLRDMSNDERIRWIQPFNHHELQTATVTTSQRSLPPLPVPGSAKGARVTIIDTGADLTHRDLQAHNIAYQDLVDARDAGYNEHHGTSILGLIAAQPHTDSSLVRGLASEASVQHLRGCWEQDGRGRCNTLTLALALEAALAYRPHVVNLSLTGPKDRVLDELIGALADQGTIVVSAFDDSRTPSERFPMPAENVLYAAAGERLGVDTGHPRTYRAPGAALSLSPMDDYALVSGHSVAAPYLTAIVARLATREARTLALVERLEQIVGPGQ